MLFVLKVMLSIYKYLPLQVNALSELFKRKIALICSKTFKEIALMCSIISRLLIVVYH
jgi:hypothetical protein